MRYFLRGALKALIFLAVILAVVIGLVLGFLYSPFFRFPTDGEYPPPRIDHIIWPTIGYPVMVVPGGTVEVEVDLRGEAGPGPQPEEVNGWDAVISPAREELAGLSYTLEPAGSRIEASRRWPEGSREGLYGSVWHVEFEVPEGAFPELYDLRIEAEVSGKVISGSQPHAVAVTADDDNDFTFITIADIHVHERDNSTLLTTQTDKGISQDGEPLFFEAAISQINLIKPDFVLMLGDFVRGQRRPGELQSEYERFYETLLDLEVPAFLLPGNHDQYINEIDGAKLYEQNIGPLYYSFDVGDCHFTCLDTYEWPEEDRIVMNKLAFMEPRKWQGQVLGAGDESDESTYTGQLAWAAEDLSLNHRAPLKVMAMHHDPYTPGGEGRSYGNVTFGWICGIGGGGEGREALMELASRHRVDMVLGGHRHLDDVGRVPWEDGGGETVYSCQTCVYYDGGGRDEKYPGYRLVEVEDAEITGFAYLDGVHSFPFYDGSVPGGENDLDHLDRPALWAEETEGNVDGGWRLSWEVGSYLGVEMEVRGLVAPAPEELGGEYGVEGGEAYRAVDIPARPGWVLLYLKTTAEAGVPGEAADLPGEPSITTVTVHGD